jgi:L-lactate utilization protein LutB
MKKWDELAEKPVIEKVVTALAANGITAVVVDSGEQAREKVLELVPEGVEVMTMTSETLDSIGIPEIINESGKYDSVRKKLMAMNRETQGREMQKLGAAPDYAIGSVHAVTTDGKAIIVSNTGSQLPAYAYGSAHVIWVVGAQKIVKDIDEAMERIYEYVLPLESKRVQKAYGMPHSNVSKKLVVSRENVEGRIQMIIVREVLGF